MNHSTPGLPVHHQLPKFTQTHVHRVSDVIQPSHPLSSPSFLPQSLPILSLELLYCEQSAGFFCLCDSKLYLNSLLYQWNAKCKDKQETQETLIQSLGLEDSLEDEMVTHSSILA